MRNFGIDFLVGGNVVDKDVLNQILGAQGGGFVNTAIATVGDGVITAAALDGGLITRTGPVAAFTDTTATAAAMAALLEGDPADAETFGFVYKNNTAFPMTMVAGAGVTLAATVIVPPFSAAQFYGTMGGTAAAPTVTLGHVQTNGINLPASLVNPGATALGGTGNAVVTAAGIVGGVTTRSAQTAARTDTTDTAVAIIAAASGLGAVSKAMPYRYVNNGTFPITLAGGVGVTISGATVVPANSWVEFRFVKTAAATLDMIAVAQGYFPKRGTVIANGATPVAVSDARVTDDSQIDLTLKTIGGTVSPSARPNVVSVTPGVGFSIGATASDTSTYGYEIRG